MNQPPRSDDGSDAYARDRLGRILRDRYGNPVPRRPEAGSADRADRPRGRHARRDDATPDNSTRVYGGPHRDTPHYRHAAGHSADGTGRGTGRAPGRAERPETYRDRYPQQPPRPERPDRAHRPERPDRGGRPPQRPQLPRRAPRARRPRTGGRRWGLKRIVLTVVAVLVVLGAGTAWWVDSSLNRTDALAGYDGRPGNTKGTNWLLVGSDSREGLSEEDGERYAAGDLSEGGQRTDTIIVVHVPRFGGKPTMVSIPRDSYVSVPGYGQDKINAAFSYGGPQLLQQTIEQNTGMRIDHYMELGFGGFAGIVDAVGGVTLCPAEPIDDPMAGLDVEAGCQTMDGPTALGYVRTRYTSANGDLDRVERQREFLTAVIKKVGSFSTMVNPFRAFPLVRSLTKAVTVDDHDHVQHLAGLALGLFRGSEQQTVPVGGFADTDAGSVVLWDDEAAEKLFETMR